MLVFIEPLKADLRKYGYKKGDYANFSVEISEGMVDDMDKLIKDTWSDIKKLKFEKLPARDEDKCGKCDFDYICWGGAS